MRSSFLLLQFVSCLYIDESYVVSCKNKHPVVVKDFVSQEKFLFSVVLSVVKYFGIVNCALLSLSIVLADTKVKPHCAVLLIAAPLTVRAHQLVPCSIHTNDFITPTGVLISP